MYIINAPTTFRYAWKIVSPFLAKKTTEKINFPSGNDKQLKELLRSMIPDDVLPVEYGGQGASDIKQVPVEAEVADYVRHLNRAAGVDAPSDWAPLPAQTEQEKREAEKPALAMALAMAAPVVRGVAAGGRDNEKGGDGDSSAEASALELEEAHAKYVYPLVGVWVVDSGASDSIEPVLVLQGLTYIKRKAARFLTLTQSIQITGGSINANAGAAPASGSGSVVPDGEPTNPGLGASHTVTGPTPTGAEGAMAGDAAAAAAAATLAPKMFQITTRTGPVTALAQGEMDTGLQGAAGNGSNDGRTAQSQERVTVRTVDAPQHLAQKTAPKVVEMAFELANGDSRVVHHGLHRDNVDTKVMSICYSKPDGKSATVVMVSDRKKGAVPAALV